MIISRVEVDGVQRSEKLKDQTMIDLETQEIETDDTASVIAPIEFSSSEFKPSSQRIDASRKPKIDDKCKPKDHPGLKIGDCLQNKTDFYHIDSQIGVGGMSIIWKAHNVKNQQNVIIKQYLVQKFFNSETEENECEKYWIREKMILEKQMLSPIHTIHCLDAIQNTDFKDPEYYLVLEYIDGQTLSEWLNQNVSGMPKSPVIIASILAKVIVPLCNHLMFIHHQGIIHRDITYKNIIMNAQKGEYTPILIDWGVAKERNLEEIFAPTKPYFDNNTKEATTIRSIGNSPEVVNGLEPIAVTDIYMLGHLIYFLLTGGKVNKDPFIVQDYVLHLSAINPAIPARLNILVESITQYEPADRIPNCEAVRTRTIPNNCGFNGKRRQESCSSPGNEF